ncbi:enoyl-CoA hydratase-related protein [Pseudalkalibacillus caeni]|uniref:Enoyl-CoA hydratase n=1 Tax=Exobacillus caeni TaxID=2574798 RepID=A0A5R9F9M2_9BACL|nr:enoyl-CoA hydratase-related protein [Pseudalkalibacillus caeni]TLS38338.1 enoyl-CoA hydratase [Pseudalkalibacillus caeni]
MQNKEFIKTWVEGKVGVIQLDRPKVLNAINTSMVREIVETAESFDREDDVMVIVIRGDERTFAAGADIDEMAEVDAVTMELRNQFTDWDRLAIVKKPMIAAVTGYAFGGGFELVLCCDMVFASENAQVGFPEVKLGVMPGAGGTQRLTKLVGKTKALEWLWFGDAKPASEAYDLGVINRLFAPEVLFEETMKVAHRLSEQAPISVRLIKESVNKAVDYSVYEGMQYERKNFYMLFATEDQKEGMAAFKEKRKPHFKGK